MTEPIEPANPSDSTRPPRRLSVGCLALRLVGGSAFVLVLGLAVWLMVWRGQHQHAIEAELARLRSEGQPLTLDDLDASYRLDPDRPDATAAWERVFQIMETKDFEALREPLALAPDGRRYTEQSIPPESLQQFLEYHSDVLMALDEAVAGGSNARYTLPPTDWFDDEAVWQIPVNRVVFSLRYRCIVARREGRIDDAIGDIEAIVAVRKSFEALPCIIAHSLQHGYVKVAFQSAATLLADEALTDVQLDRLQRIWSGMDLRSPLLWALAGERASWIGSYQESAGSESLWSSLHREVWPTPPTRAMARACLDSFRIVTSILGQTRGLKGFDQAIDEVEILETIDPLTHYATVTLLENLAKEELLSDTSCNLLLAGIAVRRYHNRTGRWPEDWSDLSDVLPGGEPLDPFVEQPLLMRRINDEAGPTRMFVDDTASDGPTGTGLVIYSVGVNRVDDGGCYDNSSGLYGFYDGNQGGDQILFLADKPQRAAYVPLPPLDDDAVDVANGPSTDGPSK